MFDKAKMQRLKLKSSLLNIKQKGQAKQLNTSPSPEN